MAIDSTTPSIRLQCGVIGAGIAGLCAAIALCRAGHDVELFERSEFKQEIGAAISLGPNANLILEKWGFSPDMAGGTPKRQLRMLQFDTLEIQYRETYDHIKEKYGYPFNAYHRIDLHKKLREMATTCGAQIRLGSEVKDANSKDGVITFTNGESLQKDLLVLANGVKSQFIAAITGREAEDKEPWGSVFRAIIPIDRLMVDETVRPILENEPSGFVISAGNKNVGIVAYPCRDDTMMNIVVVHPTLHHLQGATGWSSPATVDDVLGVLDGFSDMWRNLVKSADADAFTVYRVQHRTAISTMANGKACIIGDAAHGMLPTYTQGGCMGIEDAAALEVLIAKLTPEEGVENRLKLWNQLRLTRCIVTQFLSNRMYTDNADRDLFVKKLYPGPLPDWDTAAWSDQWNDIFFRYNIFDEAQKAFEHKDSPNGIPDGAVNFFGPYEPADWASTNSQSKSVFEMLDTNDVTNAKDAKI